MTLEDEILKLESIAKGDDWAFLKSQIVQLKKAYETNLKSLEQIKDPVKNGYCAGYIRAMEDFERLPELVLQQKRTAIEMMKIYARSMVRSGFDKAKSLQERLKNMYFGT